MHYKRMVPMRGAPKGKPFLRAVLLLFAVSLGTVPGAFALAAGDTDSSGGLSPQLNNMPTSQQAAQPLPSRLAFTHLTAQQGLSSDLAQATVEDHTGFIWVGTSNGLNRYSGSTITIYQHKAGDPTTLSNNYVLSLFVDKAGTLWVGTNSGLNSYDGATDRFKTYLHDPTDRGSLSNDVVMSIFQDSAGRLWIGTNDGLNKFDPATGVFTIYRNDPADPTSLSNNNVRAIDQDRAGNLWVATYGGGLDTLDPATGQFTAYRHDPANPKTISTDLVQKVLQDQSGNLWVGTWGGGLNRFDPASGQFTAYRHDPANPGSIPDDRVMALCLDSSGALWIGTYTGGVSIFDAANRRFMTYRAEPSDPDSLLHNRVVDLYQDRSGLMWVTTQGGGISLYNRQQQAFAVYRNNPGNPDSLASGGVYATYQDKNGTVWAGTQDHGLERLDPATGKVTHYPPDPSNPQTLTSATIFGLTGDGKDDLWVTTYGSGLYHFDPAKGAFTAYRHDPSNPRSLSDDSVTAIDRDSKGNLWLGTETGLERFDPATGVFTAYKSDAANPHSLTSGRMVAVMVANDGTVWTSGPSGLNHLDPSSGQVTRYQHDPEKADSLGDNYIFKVHQDPSGTVWAGGFDGILSRFNPQSGGFDKFLHDSTGPAENIAGVFDEVIGGAWTGNLWIMRDHSLVKFDTHTQQYRVYTTADGLPNVQATRGGSKGNDGQLLLGTTKGLITVDPSKVQIDETPPAIAFTDFLLENTQVPLGEKSALQKSIDKTESIQLTYKDSVVSFGFTALSFRGPQQVRYRYRLEGFESSWNEVGSDRRLVTYTNLPPGNYVFQVTASNADGVWNPAAREISVAMMPPWWETPLFRVTGVVLALIIVGILYWQRTRSFEEREHALERGISQRTAQLAATNSALQAEIAVRKQTETALQQSNEELLALNQMSQALSEWADLRKVLEGVGATMSSLFGGSIVSIWALDNDPPALTRLLMASPHVTFTEHHRVLLEDDPISREALDRGQSEVLDNRSELPLVAKSPDLPVIEAAGGALLVPLQSGGDPIGLLCIRATDPEHTFTPANTILAQTIAGTLAHALENARLLTAERSAAAAEERSRIAAELHDSVSQSLFAASLTANVLVDLWEANPEKGRRASAAVQQFTESAMAQMRTLLVELRAEALINTPLSDLLNTLRVAIPPTQDLNVGASLSTVPLLPPEVQIALYRIAQEALNNVVKHARAPHATVNLELAPPLDEQAGSEPWCGTLVLRITDDGLGFDPSQPVEGRLGMGNMRERATGIGATLSVTSHAGQGTQVEVCWTGCASTRETA